jgi:predicted phosphatase
MDGAVEKITELSKTYRICIFTTRANTVSGEKAVMEFLNEYRVPWDEVIGKPIAVAYIDDRAIHFESWDSIEVNR